MTNDNTDLRSHWIEGGDDRCSKAGAVRLASDIKEYWAERNYGGVKTQLAESFEFQTKPLVGVRTDLVNGLPRDWRPEDTWKIFADLRSRWPRRVRVQEAVS
jgi:hypothetical protein